MKLEELQVYQLAMDMAERVWTIVVKWNFFAKDTVGKQLVRTADSVVADLSEGFGIFFYKENRQFCYYSRGSLYESKTWIKKAHNRQLLDDKTFNCLNKDVDTIFIKLNNYINSIGKQKQRTANVS